MKPFAPDRGLLLVVVMAAVCAALLATSIILFHAARARDVPLPAPTTTTPGPAATGIVCFGTVDLEHGVTSVCPLQPGRVAEILVRENQVVPQGAELLRLEDTAARSRLAEVEAALELSRIQLQQAQRLPQQQRGRIDRQQSVLQVARSRLAAARELLARRQKLALQPNAVAAVEVSASETQVRELDELERVETQRLAELQAEDTASEARRAECALAIAEAHRDQARLALDECRVKAPRPGTVLRILVGPGDVLGGDRGQPAVQFAADGPQVIRATVEQEFAPRIKEGDAAVFHDDDAGSITWRGRVERVAGWYSQRSLRIA